MGSKTKASMLFIGTLTFLIVWFSMLLVSPNIFFFIFFGLIFVVVATLVTMIAYPEAFE